MLITTRTQYKDQTPFLTHFYDETDGKHLLVGKLEANPDNDVREMWTVKVGEPVEILITFAPIFQWGEMLQFITNHLKTN